MQQQLQECLRSAASCSLLPLSAMSWNRQLLLSFVLAHGAEETSPRERDTVTRCTIIVYLQGDYFGEQTNA
jgi:hypothetical protein